jgi:hypothetical protein
MDSIMNDFDVDKPLPSVISIKCAENHLYRIGLSLFSFGSQTRNRYHNPFFISFIISVQILKCTFAILIKKEKFIHLLIGDFLYFVDEKSFLNSCMILWGLLALSSQLLHYWKYYKNESPSYLKPFEMISGLVSPKSIGLINKEHINQLLKRSKLIFKFSRILIISFTFSGLSFSSLILIPNSTIYLILIEVFWITFFTEFIYFSANINFSQMTYFYIICLYLKLKLRNANNSIRKSFEKKYKMTNNRIKNILKSLDSTISEISTYNNDLWSKYLMIFLLLLIVFIDLILFESIFGKMNLIFKIILFYCAFIAFVIMIILINTASSVSFETKKSYKLFNKLFIDFKKNEISIFIKIKA